MDWRTWVHTRLINDAALTAIVPAANVYGAGSLNDKPPVPFIQVMMAPKRYRDGTGRAAIDSEIIVHVHDDPGSYLRIDQALLQVRNALEGQVTEIGALTVEWQGDSSDLADDGYKTIVRNGSYRLVERDT